MTMADDDDHDDDHDDYPDDDHDEPCLQAGRAARDQAHSGLLPLRGGKRRGREKRGLIKEEGGH
jgi:hypothetical protein